MATYYVGIGGNNANAGTSWAQRKATLNGAEDIPVAAGDTVYVGPGTYRETLTVDVSGTAEAGAISYIGDYDGSHTTGTKGVVRITGSNDDITETRTDCIIASSKNYRTFRGFALDGSTATVNLTTGTNWVIDECVHTRKGIRGIRILGATSAVVISNNFFYPGTYHSIEFSHSSVVSDTGHRVENCIFMGTSGMNGTGIRIDRIGGITVNNCNFYACYLAVNVGTVPDTGQTITVNNCHFTGSYIGARSATVGYLIENYNNFVCCENNRSNVDVGANSNSHIPLYDTRWFFEMVAGGSMLTPFDLASYSGLINVAGTSPTTADMRGTGKIGAEREWGALEYDPNLDIEAGSGGSGGAVRISPAIGRLG